MASSDSDLDDSVRNKRLSMSLDDIMNSLNSITSAWQSRPEGVQSHPVKKSLSNVESSRKPNKPRRRSKKPAPIDIPETVHDEPDYRYYKSPLDPDRPLVVKSADDHELFQPPPSKPRMDDEFVDMFNEDWDVYKTACGRYFYHNPTSEISSWAPNSSKVSGKVWSLPRTQGSNGTRKDSVNSQDNQDVYGDDDDGEKRTSIVRDSIRRSDEIQVVPPPGYTELYDKTTGHISYHDNVRDITWQTALDSEGNLYFYTDDGRSEWQLPQVPSKLGHSGKPQPHHESFNVLHSGWILVRGSLNKVKSKTSKKWEPYFGAISDGHLLIFTDELSFKRMHLSDVQDVNPPIQCVDLSQCELRWSKKQASGKSKQVMELVSKLGTTRSMKLGWTEDNLKKRDEWFEALRTVVKVVEESGVISPGFLDQESESKHSSRSAGWRQSDNTKRRSFSAPGTPSLSSSRTSTSARLSFRRKASGDDQRPKVDISSPTNFTKATQEELFKKLNLDSAEYKRLVESPKSPETHFNKATDHIKSDKYRKVTRGGPIASSFKRMAETVHLRPKKKVERTPSLRAYSNFLNKFFDPKSDDKDRRSSRDDLRKKGILKPEEFFGNELNKLRKDPNTGIPDFIVQCVRKIEKNIDSEGIYRKNGDAAKVQKIRVNADHEDFKLFESTSDVHTLTSTLKLFCRELPEPLISKETRVRLQEVIFEHDANVLADQFSTILKETVSDETSLRTIEYLALHLHRVSEHKENKMGPENLAIVFSPNLMHCASGTRRPESIISEMEVNSLIVEIMIKHAKSIFNRQK